MADPALRPSERFLTGRTVLVVEDDLDSLDMLRQMVASLGAQALLARDGLEGLQVLREEAVDLALVDIRMPRLDGIQFIQRLRAEPQFVRLPVIAVTALGQDRDYLSTFEAGFDAHLTKPIDYELVAAVISRVVPSSGTPAKRRRSRRRRPAESDPR
jgi:CheY-like chemotaxis protein